MFACDLTLKVKKIEFNYLEKHHINNNVYLINIFVVTQTYFTTEKAKIKYLKKKRQKISATLFQNKS